MLRLKRTSSR